VGVTDWALLSQAELVRDEEGGLPPFELARDDNGSCPRAGCRALRRAELARDDEGGLPPFEHPPIKEKGSLPSERGAYAERRFGVWPSCMEPPRGGTALLERWPWFGLGPRAERTALLLLGQWPWLGLGPRADCEEWPRAEGLRAVVVLAGVLAGEVQADSERARKVGVEGELGSAVVGLSAIEREEALLVDVALFLC